MKNYLLAASAAIAAVAMAPAAHAANFNINLVQNGNTFTADFGNEGLNGAFSDTFTFLPALSESLGDIGLIQLGLNMASITFTTLKINDYDLMPFLSPMGGGQGVGLLELPLGPGTHVLTVAGNAGGNASYSGLVNFVTTPVPEAATWAMMILGLAAVGFTMRRRSYTQRVAFS